MGASDNEIRDPSDGVIATELLISAQRTLAEAEALLANLNSKLDEVAAARTHLAEVAGAAQTKLSEISAVTTAALALKTQISDEQAVIAAKSAHIQDAQAHADKVRAELDRIQTAASQSATEAEGLRVRSQTASDSAAEVLATIRASKTTAEGELAATLAARDLAKAATATTKELADKAEIVGERIAVYEARLAELETQSKAQLETITGLLPSATAAGLAHEFDARRATFLKPANRWQWLFVCSVLALVALALSGLRNVYGADSLLGWDDLARLWLARLPIAGALIWLALHASRESALAKRLEEDYGYKAAIASSFQGFQKQMADIGASAKDGSPLAKLCDDTLSTIASPPGRIYDRHRLTVTPTAEITSAATAAVASARPK